MVPVISFTGQVLFPCKERRARCLMKKGEAKPYWQKGIFCIKLTRPETTKRQEYPPIALGVDPGSKREAYTVATPTQVVLNITTDTKEWVKQHVETRRTLRRSRRYRKTPYRACRPNRGVLRKGNRVPPSTKTRWDTKLQLITNLTSILPISIVNIEDIKAITHKGKDKRNTSFSPLEVGKAYFEQQFISRFPDIKLVKTLGYQTSAHRKTQGYHKSKKKLDFTWETHNVDSHCLVEIALQTIIKPFLGLYQINFLRFHRRQLQAQQPQKGNIRKPYGTTISLGMSRGSIVKYQDKLYYLGGSSKGKLSLHSIISGKRVKKNTNKEEIKIMYRNNRRVQFLPSLKEEVSL